MKKPSIVLYLLLFASSVSIQIQAQNRITGSVLDASNKPLGFANVLLLQSADSALVRGLIAAEDGSYLFENIGPGTFLLQFSMIGFEQSCSEVFTLSGVENAKTIKPVVLKESSNVLGEVQIVAKRPFLEQKIDRTVVNVANSVANAGSNALQVLQRSPGIQVNLQTKAISLVGKQGVVVMINGKIYRLPTEAVVDMLSGMNADNIDYIELIHTPPANFEAEGNAGIINIVLKNTGEKGLNGGYSANAGYGRGEKYGAGVYFNYRKNKVNWFGAYDYNFNLNPQVFTNYRGVQQNGNFLETETYSDRPHTPTGTQNGRLGADFQLSKKTVLGVLGTYFDRNWYMEAVNSIQYSKNGALDSRLQMPNSETNHSRSFAGNLNFTHQFSQKQSITLDADYVFYNTNNPSNYEIQNLDNAGNVIPQYQLRIYKNTPIKVGVAKADYSLSLGKNGKLEAGGKFTSMQFDNDVQVDSLPAQQDWITLSDYTSLFHLKEYVGGTYASFSTKLDAKTDLKAGLRYEFTNTNLGSETQPNVVDREYGSWFPSFFLSRQLTETQKLSFSYSRRISRPQIRHLAPWLIFSDPSTLESGNPALQPSFTNALKLDYGIKTWGLGVSYSLEKSPMRYVPSVDPVTNRQVNFVQNLDLAKVLGAYVFMTLHPAKWWTMNNNIYLNATEINMTLESKSIQIQNTTYGFNTTNSFNLSRGFSLEISGNYDSPGYWGVAKWDATGTANIGLEKNFGAKWGKLRLNATDLFLSSNWYGLTEQPALNLLVKSSYQMAERTFMLSWTNTFGNAKLKSARQRQTGSAEEMRRL